VELEAFNYEHGLKLCAERNKYQKILTLEMNKYNKLREEYVNKLKKRHGQIGIRIAPSSQPCTADEEAYVEEHAAPPPSCGVNIATDQSVHGVEGRCDGFLSSSSTTFNEKDLEVDVVAYKEKLSSINVALDGVNHDLILGHGRRRAVEVELDTMKKEVARLLEKVDRPSNKRGKVYARGFWPCCGR
jgi:hypothetical protein